MTDISSEKASRAVDVLLCVSVPSFMINLDSNIVAVSLPSISQSLGADFTAIEWVISAYTLAFASLVLPAGSLADRYGRKRMLILGLTIFTLASFFCGAAPNVIVLDVARVFQGVGAALQLSAALAILSHSFHGACPRAGLRLLGIGRRHRDRLGTGRRRGDNAAVRMGVGVLREHPDRRGDDRADHGLDHGIEGSTRHADRLSWACFPSAASCS